MIKINEDLLNTQYKNLFKKLKRYWEIYGGLKQFYYSPYFHFAFICALIINYFKVQSFQWQQITLQIIPNMLGFTLIGYIMLLLIRDKNFLSILTKELSTKKSYSISYFDKLSTIFIHFALMQILLLLLTMITKSLEINLYFIGTLLLFYTVLLFIALIFAVYQTIELFKIYLLKYGGQNENNNSN